MRQIFLDTETTGLEANLGHRVVELAGVELVNRRQTGRRFHRYLNPERACDLGALAVHGLTDEFLRDKPRFSEIVAEFLDYVSGAELIIHNAPFDVAFLNREFVLLDMPPISDCCSCVTDTMRMAKEIHPGKRNSLDALCERYQINNAARTLHGALLDAELLAEVYLAMTRGQESLIIELAEVATERQEDADNAIGFELIVIRASDEELAMHAQQLEEIGKASNGACVWLEQAARMCA
ncbi:MAG: DNA polymerase III subunit epsilon [Burkholderiales bacterium]|nr:DNA polymerase III subunit epsilon [Burkholderiales bacterium]